MEADPSVSFTSASFAPVIFNPLFGGYKFLEEFRLKSFSDLAEAKAFIKAFKPEVTDARVEEIFKKYDADNSGTLDKDECKKLATDMKLLG